MGSEVSASCCCQQGQVRLWYAIKCPTYFASYCCPPDCTQAVNRIDFCDAYLSSLGIPLPPVLDLTTKCYLIAYDCCIYVLTGFELVTVCPPVAPTNPINEGRLHKIRNVPTANCCYAEQQGQDPIGGLSGQEVGGQPVFTQPVSICEELVAECYPFTDQNGTVKGKGVNISSNATTCVLVSGVPPGTRCDHGPPTQYESLSIGMSQDIDSCTIRDTLSSCQNQITQYTFEYFSCPDCEIPDNCCGENIGLCQYDPTICDTVENPMGTYAQRTCYSVNYCANQDHVEDILYIDFDACFAPDIDPDSKNAQAELDALFINGVVAVDPSYPVNTGWGVFNVPRVKVCNLYVIMFSGNAGHLAERINSRIGALASAHGVAPWSAYFWYGVRQSCLKCDWQTPNDQPPSSFGDSIYVDRVEFINANTQIRVWLKASSPRWYVCGTQRLINGSASRDITNCSISAYGNYPYIVHCLSFPEFGYGMNYTMRRVEETASTQLICIGDNTNITVASCDARVGYPLDDVVVLGVTIAVGWRTLCAGCFEPTTICHNYYWDYQICPCCPYKPQSGLCPQWYADNPCPVICEDIPEVEQCQSDGTVLVITRNI